jgi:hypothetical protein
MCLGLIVMTWRSGPALPWVQAAVFGCAVLWFGLAALGRTAGARARRAAGRHDALMAAAMIWMIFAMPTAMPTAPAHGGMPAMSRPATTTAVLVVSALLAAYFGLAAITWLVRATGPGPRLRDRVAAGQAAMSTGMAMLLLAML